MQVLVVSSNSIGALNHGIAETGSLENIIHLSRVTTNSLQPQNVTIIPLNVNCGENITGFYIFQTLTNLQYILYKPVLNLLR